MVALAEGIRDTQTFTKIILPKEHLSTIWQPFICYVFTYNDNYVCLNFDKS